MARSEGSYITGTTYRVYRFMFKSSRPVGISEVQKGLGLSSPSVAQYHIKKLVDLGLVREKQEGYVIDKVVLENIIRIRSFSIPVQTAYVAFFLGTLAILLAFLRPASITSVYFFAVAINVSALVVTVYEALKTIKRL